MLKPQAKNFHTNDGMHAAMRDWANAQAKPEMEVVLIFSDRRDEDDVFRDSFKRVQKEVAYKTPDGETYTVGVDTAKFENTFMSGYPDELASTDFKKAFADWAGRNLNKGVSVVSIKWKLAK